MKIAAAMVMLLATTACASSSATHSTSTGTTTSSAATSTAAKPAVETTASANPDGYVPRKALGITDLRVGSGQKAVAGACLYVHYEGALPNGHSFETSRTPRADGKAPDPIAFELGAGMVMPGWEKGLAGMQVGGRRRITIPPHLGYGAQGAGGVIKGGETLVFVVDLLGVR